MQEHQHNIITHRNIHEQIKAIQNQIKNSDLNIKDKRININVTDNM